MTNLPIKLTPVHTLVHHLAGGTHQLPASVLTADLLRDGRLDKLCFTAMLTHGQSDFYVQYINPESHTLRSYYPDFLFQKQDGSYVIVEVKRADKIQAPVVQAKKDFAQHMAIASGMTYHIISGHQANTHHYGFLIEGTQIGAAQHRLSAKPTTYGTGP